jgi:hypothetical protein
MIIVSELVFCSAVENADGVLPSFADAVSKYMGMVAIVTLVGPVGKLGGEITVTR